ncbi:uncharacterized protein si:dkey-181m9.8 isoform X2 [Esox lucius]|uniref:uncharacterized protein si:dkey-181m9.8 isoform X2 n=1 Tax=Esox lucius TaxID=8010 RepID=UPI001476C73C|nr:uncharacterized protein si:dkey-181m9.8 isoform X2 [Esox lucius]
MPRVPGNLEYETLTECKYSFPGEVVSDIKSATATYGDLRTYVDFYCFPNKERKRLVFLGGTIPVQLDGHTYNIPVCIWLHETHPQSRPRCYVCSSASLTINPRCPYVEASGLVTLDCLTNWNSGLSNLSVLITEMRSAFQKETPLYAAYPVRAQKQPAAARSGVPTESSDPGSRPQLNTSTPKARRSSIPSALTTETALLRSLKSSQSGPLRESGPGVRRSYTEELLSMGITFGAPVEVQSPFSSTNPFITTASVPTTAPMGDEDMNNLFKSLQLENVVNIYQLTAKERGPTQVGGGDSGGGDLANGPEVTGPVDDRHRILVSRLPRGQSPSHVRNKLTLYFQRRSNGGGEVLDVTYPYPPTQADQALVTFRSVTDAEQVLLKADRIVIVNAQPFMVQLKRFDRAQVPPGVPSDKADIFQSLLSLEGRSFSPTDVEEAVKSCRDFPTALKYLSHECPICREQVSFSKIITMTHCPCAFCESCFKAYFSQVIKEKSITHVVCPLCGQPDVRQGQGGVEVIMDYFSLLDTQCSFGLLHEADQLRMDCPSCKKSTCSQCKTAWAPQHEGLSCEKFKEWQLHNNPEYQKARLEYVLSRNKIECPKCRFVFYLSKGGCLHFRCTQCQHDFCGGCSRPFKPGLECGFSADCGSKGLHAHHPRDCLYHLRDWNVPRLHKLLQLYKVPLEGLVKPKDGPERSSSQGACVVLEYKESGREDPCSRPPLPEYNGYCCLHYKECLVELINGSLADPAALYNMAEIVAELQRWHVPVPQRNPKEPEALYMHRLRQILTQEVGLKDHKLPPVRVKDDLCPVGPPWSSAQSSTPRHNPDNSQLLLFLNE